MSATVADSASSVAAESASQPSTRLGLVVEGGGYRALYAAGVLDVLLDLKLPVAGGIGVSAGAIHGISYASFQ